MPKSGASAPRRLQLELVFRDLDRDLAGVTAVVHVEDVAHADAPARSLATQRFPGLAVSRSRPTATVDLALPDLADARQPAIRVHVDTSGSGAIRPGHFVNPTTSAVPDPSVPIWRIELVRVA